MVERFLNALQGLDVSFIADDTLQQLPLPSSVGQTRVGGINFHQLRMRRVTEALLALSSSPRGFTASTWVPGFAPSVARARGNMVLVTPLTT
jgi:hypothetical protein